MTIIVFLIDTSASMHQKTFVAGRTTLLDVAKSAVETFVKLRQRSVECRVDRYMLLTFEESPNNIKAGWKENLTTFMNELKNLPCYSMTTMGVAVKQAFDILNINRMTSGIDTYGQGRCPFFLETSVIVLITDGGRLSTCGGVHDDFNLPMTNPIPGSELTREPFRWDQRLFALVLRLTGTPAIERDTGLVPSDSSPIDAMCEVTGGRSYCITSHRMLNQCIESLVQKVQNGVVINFEKIGPDPPPPNLDKTDDLQGKDDIDANIICEQLGDVSNLNLVDRLQINLNGPHNTSWHNCRRMIYVPRSTQKGFPLGHWPLPESFWPELTAAVLPPRTAHPNIKFTCTSSDPMVIENLPFDKYELEPSPLTQYILSRKQPTVCWQVFVANSYKSSEVGHPFGYLKASTNLSCVNLFVMPYNYPVLLPLLDDLLKIHRWKPSNEWKTQFQNYIRTLPAYYAGPLRRAITRMGAPVALSQTLIPESAENCLSYSIHSYLKRLKNQAKSEYDRICGEIIQRLTSVSTKNSYNSPEQIRITPRLTLKKDLISHPLLIDKFICHRDQLVEPSSKFVITIDKDRATVSFKNPFDVPRDRLIEQVDRMRNNFVQTDWRAVDHDTAHSLPICQMGNYQEYLRKQMPQLREIESAPVRQHMFGNPFKVDKRMMVDEADIDLVGSGAPGTNRVNKRLLASIDITMRLPTKRKPGPLPRDYVYRRPNSSTTSTPMNSAPASPVPWVSYPDKEVASIMEKKVDNSTPVNGIDSIAERPRSPSPTLLNELPMYGSDANNLFMRPTFTIQAPYSPLVINEMPNNVSYSVNNDDRLQISQILKEANAVAGIGFNHYHLITPETKNVKVEVENKQEIASHNCEMRKVLNKLVRRPGKNFTELFDNIRLLKGNADIQVAMVKLIIKESLRFKRQYLVNLLEEHIQNLLNAENK